MVVPVAAANFGLGFNLVVDVVRIGPEMNTVWWYWVTSMPYLSKGQFYCCYCRVDCGGFDLQYWMAFITLSHWLLHCLTYCPIVRRRF